MSMLLTLVSDSMGNSNFREKLAHEHFLVLASIQAAFRANPRQRNSMERRISTVTLGVADLEHSENFMGALDGGD